MRRFPFRVSVFVAVLAMAAPIPFQAGSFPAGAPRAMVKTGLLPSPPETHEFVSDASTPIAGGCYGAIAGDLRNDGVNRIVAGTWGSHYAYVFRNQGGTYVEEWSHLYGSGDNVIPVAVGDADNDGRNEFLIHVYGTGTIYMYRWDGAAYQKVHEQYFGGLYQPAAIFDIDRDGANELVVDGSGAAPYISVYNYNSSVLPLTWPGRRPMGTPFRSRSAIPTVTGSAKPSSPSPGTIPPAR